MQRQQARRAKAAPRVSADAFDQVREAVRNMPTVCPHGHVMPPTRRMVIVGGGFREAFDGLPGVIFADEEDDDLFDDEDETPPMGVNADQLAQTIAAGMKRSAH